MQLLLDIREGNLKAEGTIKLHTVQPLSVILLQQLSHINNVVLHDYY